MANNKIYGKKPMNPNDFAASARGVFRSSKLLKCGKVVATSFKCGESKNKYFTLNGKPMEVGWVHYSITIEDEYYGKDDPRRQFKSSWLFTVPMDMMGVVASELEGNTPENFTNYVFSYRVYPRKVSIDLDNPKNGGDFNIDFLLTEFGRE